MCRLYFHSCKYTCTHSHTPTHSDSATKDVWLHQGDQVEFDIFIEKRSGRKGATNIRLLRLNTEDRLQGRITKSVDNSHFGFIHVNYTSDEQRHFFGADSTFFHMSDILPPSVWSAASTVRASAQDEKQRRDYVPMAGDEVEFKLIKLENGKTKAIRIVVLPKGMCMHVCSYVHVHVFICVYSVYMCMCASELTRTHTYTHTYTHRYYSGVANFFDHLHWRDCARAAGARAVG